MISNRALQRNPFLRFWKDFIFRKMKAGPPECSTAMRNNAGLMLFIWARYTAVACLKGTAKDVDPTGGTALNLVLG